MPFKKAKRLPKAKHAEPEPDVPELEAPKTLDSDWPAEAPVLSSGPLCGCGKPVAEGQTSVCKDHIRRN